MKKQTMVILPGQISVDEILSANTQATSGNNDKKDALICWRIIEMTRITDAYGVAKQN